MQKNLYTIPKHDLAEFQRDYMISYITDTDSPEDFYHPCYKIVVSLDHHFKCLIDGRILSDLRALIINKTIPHSFLAPETNILVILIKSDCPYGRQLDKYLDGNAWTDLGLFQTSEQLDDVLPIEYNELTNKVLSLSVLKFLDSLILPGPSERSSLLDDRIQSALSFINQNIHLTLELENVASYIHLSPERTRHLFSTQMGIPFTQYIIWVRMLKTMAMAVNEDRKLIDVCSCFGFVDQSHFSHTFKRIFGLTPSNLIYSNRVLV